LLISPLVAGTAACLIGNASARYHGSCVPPLLLGALGALSTIPLIYLGEQANDPNSDVNLAPIFLGAIGWFVLQPMGAVFGWHAYRRLLPQSEWRLSPPTPPPAPSFEGLLSPERPRGLARLPGEVTVPLLSLAF
jgi:hypothetical protein